MKNINVLLLTNSNSKREVEELEKLSTERGVIFSAYVSEHGELSFYEAEIGFQKKINIDYEQLPKYDVVIACCDAASSYTVSGWISFICGYCFEKKIPVIGYICNPALYGKKLPPSIIYEAQDQASQADSGEYVNLMNQESCVEFLAGNYNCVLDYLDLQKEPIKAKKIADTANTNNDGIYLAGPDIFRKDKLHYCSLQKAILLQYNLKPEHPIDNNIIDDTSPWGIFQADVGQINRSMAIFANLQPYAGQEPDDGTMFEVGYGIAKGLPVYLYPGQLFSEIAGNTQNIEELLSEKANKAFKEMLKSMKIDDKYEYKQQGFNVYGYIPEFILNTIPKTDSLKACCEQFS